MHLPCLRSLGNYCILSIFLFLSIVDTLLVLVVAEVVVVPALTPTTLGAVWSTEGNCLRAGLSVDPPSQPITHTPTFMTTRVCSGLRLRDEGNCLRAGPSSLFRSPAPPYQLLVVHSAIPPWIALRSLPLRRPLAQCRLAFLPLFLPGG